MSELPDWAIPVLEASSERFSIHWVLGVDDVYTHIGAQVHDKQFILSGLVSNPAVIGNPKKFEFLVSSAPDFPHYSWKEFDDWYKPKLGDKPALLACQIALVIGFRSNSRHRIEQINALEIKRPYIKVNLYWETPRARKLLKFVGLKNQIVIHQSDPRFSISSCLISPECSFGFFAISEADLLRNNLKVSR